MSKLHALYDYFGAHLIADRGVNERKRAAQRMVIAGAFPFWLFVGVKLGYGQSSFEAQVLLATYTGALVLLSAVYYVYLRAKPEGGIAAQYLFIVTDPLAGALAFFMEPRIFGWLAFLNIIFIARCGWHFGRRTFWLAWTSAVLYGLMMSAVIGMNSAAQIAQYVGLMAICVYLFIPALGIHDQSMTLLVEQARMATAREALRAKTEFLSKIGHEIRTPLQAIQSSLALFELEHKGDEATAMVSRVRRAALSLSAHVFDLLTLASNDTGNLVLRPRHANLTELFEAIVEDIREIAALKGLQLSLAAPPRLEAFVDPVRVGQILENLISNAVRYTDRGRIQVVLSPLDGDEGALRFEVSDTGRGIKGEDISLIFTAYERGTSGEGAAEGSGIGLAVVKTLVGHMGGNVSVTSDLGSGSTFSVEIPRVQQASPNKRLPDKLDSNSDLIAS